MATNANDHESETESDSTPQFSATDEEILEKAQQFNAFPEPEDYDPEANHNAEILGGQATEADRWDEFGLALRPIRHNGVDTDKRALLRNGKFIEVVSDQYKVLPHERLAVIADEVADELGLVRWDQFGDDEDWFIKMDKHIIMDDEGRRMHALYAKPDPVDVGDGDEIHMGVAVHNSIDRSLGFNVGLFTFRHACANMVWMGVNGEGMNFDDREVVAHHSHKHTKGLTVMPEHLYAVTKGTLTYSDTVYDAYDAWTDEYTTVDDARQLVELVERGSFPQRNLPEWLQNAYDTIEEVRERREENEELTPLDEDQEDTIYRSHLPGTDTRWDTYNDLTESIWHSDTTQDTSKQRKMKVVHRAFDPSAGRDDITIR